MQQESGNFKFFSSILATDKLQNHFFFKFLVFNLAFFWRNFTSKKGFGSKFGPLPGGWHYLRVNLGPLYDHFIYISFEGTLYDHFGTTLGSL